MKNIYFLGIHDKIQLEVTIYMDYILRKKYLSQLIEVKNTPDIKVITGIRRSGKSVLTEEYAEYLKENIADVNLVIIRLQELDYEELLEYHALNSYILEHYVPGKNNVLIIDEVQLCENFEKVINSIHSKRIYDIYITGSNAFLLSSDLATLFTGRTIEIKVFPFSFSEYLQYFNTEKAIDQAFDDYVRMGGMSGSYVYSTEKKRYEYIKDIYDTILLRDLVQKYKIRNKSELKQIAEFMMDNISNIHSPNSICDALNRDNSDITRKTVSKYIEYFEKAFLFYEVKRYDLKGKKYLESNKKYYLCDASFRYAINGIRNMDFGRVYENLVYLELIRRGYEVYIGKLYKKEIDFVASRHNEKIYIQVSDNISEEKTFEREYSPLLAINDAYPKMIIARTHHEPYDYRGIQIVDLPQWLCER